MRRAHQTSPSSTASQDYPLPTSLMDTLQSSSATWEERVEALCALEAVVASPAFRDDNQARGLLVHQVRNLSLGLKRCIQDPRSTLVKEVCRCIQTLAETFGAEFVFSVGDNVIPALLERSYTTKAVIRESSIDAAKAMFEYGVNGITFATARLVSRTVLDRKVPPAMRSAAAQFIGMILVDDCVSGLEVIGEAVEDAIIGGCCDPDEAVRAISRDNWRRLNVLDSLKARELLSRLAPQVVSLIQKETVNPLISFPRSPGSETGTQDSVSNRGIPSTLRSNPQRAIPPSLRAEGSSTSPRSPVKLVPVGQKQRGAQRAGRGKPPGAPNGVMERPNTAGSRRFPPSFPLSKRAERAGDILSDPPTFVPGPPNTGCRIIPRPPRRSVLPNMRINLHNPIPLMASEQARKSSRRSVPVMNMPMLLNEVLTPVDENPALGKCNTAEESTVVEAPLTLKSAIDEVEETVGNSAVHSEALLDLSSLSPLKTPGAKELAQKSPEAEKNPSPSLGKQVSPVTSEPSFSINQPTSLSTLATQDPSEELLTSSSVASGVNEVEQNEVTPVPVLDREGIEIINPGTPETSQDEEKMSDSLPLKLDGNHSQEGGQNKSTNPALKSSPTVQEELGGNRKGRISYILGDYFSPRAEALEKGMVEGQPPELKDSPVQKRGDYIGVASSTEDSGKVNAVEPTPENETSGCSQFQEQLVPMPAVKELVTTANEPVRMTQEIELLLSIPSLPAKAVDAVYPIEIIGKAGSKETRSWEALVEDLECSIDLNKDVGSFEESIKGGLELALGQSSDIVKSKQRGKENKCPATEKQSIPAAMAAVETKIEADTALKSEKVGPPRIPVPRPTVPRGASQFKVTRKPSVLKTNAVTGSSAGTGANTVMGRRVRGAGIVAARNARPRIGNARRSVMPGTRINLKAGAASGASHMQGTKTGHVETSQLGRSVAGSGAGVRKPGSGSTTRVQRPFRGPSTGVPRPGPGSRAVPGSGPSAGVIRSEGKVKRAVSATARPGAEKRVVSKEVQGVLEWMRRCNELKKSGWQERCTVLDGFGEACKKLQKEDKISGRLAEECVGMLGDYAQETHHKVVTSALDGLFFLLLCSQGSSAGLQRGLERREDVMHRVLGMLGSPRENLRLAAGRVLQSVEVQFRPEAAVWVVLRGLGTGQPDGRVAEAGCEHLVRAFERAAASGEGFLWRPALLEAVLRAVAAMKQDRRVGVRRGGAQVLECVRGSLPEAALRVACEKFALGRLLIT